MSQDIRLFFHRGKDKKKTEKEVKRPSDPTIICISSDEEDASPLKGKKSKVAEKRSKSKESKERSKKRTILSSDEEESANRAKHKKAKVEKNDHNEKLEVIEDAKSVFGQKPIHRINAAKKTESKTIECIVIEDDDFVSPTSSPNKNSREKEKKSKIQSNKDDKKTKDELDITHVNGKEKNKTSSKTKSNDNNDIIQQEIEMRKRVMEYRNYLNRCGVRNPGSKKVPTGAEQCFQNLCFLITGVLESFKREEIKDLIQQYGGKVLTAVSRNVNYIIVGDKPGPSKMAKAESLGIKKLSEDDFLYLLKTSPAGAASKNISSNWHCNKCKRQNPLSRNDFKSPDNKSNKIGKDEYSEDVHSTSENKKEKNKNTKSDFIQQESPADKESNSNTLTTIATSTLNNEKSIKEIEIVQPSGSKAKSEEKIQANKTINNLVKKSKNDVDHLTALVEKYRPTNLKQIIGQTDDKSNANKLLNWLTNWHRHHNPKAAKPKYPYRDDSTGGIYKAALLSGPPGIGKTTTAYVVCSQLGYEVIEFNASDTRSKKLLQEQIAGILSNKTIKTFLTDTSESSKSSKHVLLMDEIDGMSGNEDRGGMQELIAFIKSTEVPIICICNDKKSQKIRTLANYSFDLRFQKPRLEEIRDAMMSISFKEGIKVTSDELTKIIQSTNQDIRQVINHIAVLAAKSQTAQETKDKVKYKNFKLKPWEVVQKVFSAEEQKHMSIHDDKSDLFFHDYNIAPLFVKENYLIVTPSGPQSELDDKRAKCTESLAMGDLVDRQIRSNQAWSLLPLQAMFSSVIPGTEMSGIIDSRINFPSWLEKNSETNKCDRLLQDISVHARLTTGASKEAVNLDYMKIMVNSILNPLAVDGTEGIDKAIDFMNAYHLTKEDLDALVELTRWDTISKRNPWHSISVKTRIAFTKACKKQSMFSTGSTKKNKSGPGTQNDDFAGSDEEPVSDSEEDDTIENDKLIKAKKSKAKSAPSELKKKNKKATKGTISS